MKLPETFLQSMKELLGDAYEDYLRSLDAPRLYGLRVNTAKISTEDFEKIAPFPIKKIPYIPNGYFYDGDTCQPAKHPYYFAGLYYLQDPSAMTPASRLPITPGDHVLDLCAAPGGKSTELAARLCGDGLLVANDISVKRAKALQKNIELFGVKNSLITTEYPEKLASFFPGFFQKILIDAPCSGEGMFRKDPAMVKSWNEDSPAQYAAMQEDIVRHALPMLAPGGYLLYSTCTFSTLEDEGTVAKILAMDPSLSLVDIDGYEGFAPGRPDVIDAAQAGNDGIDPAHTDGRAVIDPAHTDDGAAIDIDSIKKCVRIFPHRMDGEGHFLALFHKAATTDGRASDAIDAADDSDIYPSKKRNKKSAPNPSGNRSGKLSKDERESWSAFASDLNTAFDEARIESHDGMLYYDVEGLPSAKGLRFLRNGLFLGECKKNRFEPSQALAMALRAEDYQNTLSFPAKDERVIRYLKGETITLTEADITAGGAPGAADVTADSAPGVADVTAGSATGDAGTGPAADGYVLICVDGYPLGWGKKQRQTIKNKYHTGWRLM
ncbi:MAG: RsmB/NOP family class I SAM-dependent RNA methyltransferase [Eubacterium sp.]|nr:RsmB/NOP family class I SAM-dependent RNA methyltransferase [Eubacterium sp.]